MRVWDARGARRHGARPRPGKWDCSSRPNGTRCLDRYGAESHRQRGWSLAAAASRVSAVRRRCGETRLYATEPRIAQARYLNGTRVGDQLFTPGWTSYSRRLQYQTYDVTKLLKPGDNALGAVLGDRWYRGQLGFEGRRMYMGSAPASAC